MKPTEGNALKGLALVSKDQRRARGKVGVVQVAKNAQHVRGSFTQHQVPQLALRRLAGRHLMP
eukprot:8455724-Alexandrium_andersonii.AAC.1